MSDTSDTGTLHIAAVVTYLSGIALMSTWSMTQREMGIALLGALLGATLGAQLIMVGERGAPA